MPEYIYIRKEVTEMSSETKPGDYIRWHDKIYEFKCYGYDSIIVRDIETNEEKEFDYY
jgi:hypothetical protein